MQRSFGGTVFDPDRGHPERELTIGPAMLAGIVLVLFAVCGLCFFLGYSVGHRTAQAPAASLPAPGTPLAAAQPATPQSKPSAGQGTPQAQQSVAAAEELASTDATATPAETPAAAPPPAAPGSAQLAPNPAAPANSGAPVVHNALPAQPSSAQPTSGNTGSVQPAFGQSSRIMVQIAAVSHAEDAEVLVSALRRRGYAVNYMRDPSDGLLHVQIGPFANRNDAYATRQKLLNDGYNAVVQP